ncbi:LOW QUALITY PROTEIN: hypothetical protein T265_13571 [Opisthorchis viverrini]|uniref:Uncharacterized protein n=1 Tax=Opisthorchis viverrini TaxID=6198 RepID=A0A074ZMW2_OPIVI|nr:LOW QUALITY PROTEIN: hypothetical protein T265_13571 [Opisthorchis viverrini]KER28476.1 LOW QUALITY PROTEIN: hypothetical protein T265_13571 [Opisthorchis viverrini]
MRHKGWDTVRSPKPRQGKSEAEGRVRTTDLPEETLKSIGVVARNSIFWTDRGASYKQSSTLVVGLSAEPGIWIEEVSSLTEVISGGLSGCTDIVTKRLQFDCQARRTDQQPRSAPGLPTLRKIARVHHFHHRCLFRGCLSSHHLQQKCDENSSAHTQSVKCYCKTGWARTLASCLRMNRLR